MKSICFNLFDAHSVFFTEDKYQFGGAEVRGVTIANQLSQQSIDVSVIIKQHHKSIDTKVGNVSVISHDYYSPKGISFFKKIQSSLFFFLYFKSKMSKDTYFKWYHYLKVDAEYYAAFELTETTRELVNFCEIFNRKFILFVASDGELSYDRESAGAMKVNKNLAANIIERSYKIFVQNQYQLNKLFENFNRTGIQINSPLPLNIDKSDFNTNDRKYITWIGKSNSVKQPKIFIELAKQFPNEKFFMIMNKNDNELYNETVSSLPKNIIFKESLTFHEVNQILSNSKLFINTSLYEGFPNTFLQAAYFSVPVISLNVNPDHFIDKSKGGIYCSGKYELLTEAVRNIDSSSLAYREMAKNIYSFVTKHHSVSSVANIIVSNID